MAEVTTLFWDVGGVLLTNGWDTAARRRASERFGLDRDDFDERHALVSADFEEGRLRLDEYLESTVFHQPRNFSRQEFRQFMFNQSQPFPETFSILEKLAATDKYLLATLNNESYELNLYRIEQFELRRFFTVFFSSCFLGMKKPDRALYRAALHITHRAPEECVYIDDRALNLEFARQLGVRTIHFRSADQCRRELSENGVKMP